MPDTNIQCKVKRTYGEALDPKKPKEPNARIYYPKDCGQKDVRVHIEADGSLSDGLIADGSLSLAKLADIPANTIIGNNTGSTDVPLALTATQARTALGVYSKTETDGFTVKLTGNQTINGVKTFSSPVGVPSPVAGGDAVNRLFITSNLLPLPILTAVQNYKTRFPGATEYQVLGLTELLKKIYFATGGVLPDFLAHPDFSFDLSNPASTSFYNSGSFNGGGGEIVNSTVGSMIANNKINFDPATLTHICTDYTPDNNTAFSWLFVYGGNLAGTRQYLLGAGDTRPDSLQDGALSFVIRADSTIGVLQSNRRWGFVSTNILNNSFNRTLDKKMFLSTFDGDSSLTGFDDASQSGSGANTTSSINKKVMIGGAYYNDASGYEGSYTGHLFTAMRFSQELSNDQALAIYNLF